MGLCSTENRWGLVTRCLHWLMAALIIAMLVLGMVMVDYPSSVLKIKAYAFHKALGFTLLALVVLRLAWRVLDRRPHWPNSMSRRDRRLARIGHFGLYGLMIVVPVSGWVFNSAAGFPLNWFDLARIPAIVATDEQLQLLAGTAHFAFGLLLSLLVAIHVGAALYHHFFLRDDVLRKMWRVKEGD
jgi:cytochrome b561